MDGYRAASRILGASNLARTHELVAVQHLTGKDAHCTVVRDAQNFKILEGICYEFHRNQACAFGAG